MAKKEWTNEDKKKAEDAIYKRMMESNKKKVAIQKGKGSMWEKLKRYLTQNKRKYQYANATAKDYKNKNKK